MVLETKKSVTIWGNLISLKPFLEHKETFYIKKYIHSPLTTAFMPPIGEARIKAESIVGTENAVQAVYIDFNKLIEEIISENIADYLIVDLSELWTSYFEVETENGSKTRVANYFTAEQNLQCLFQKGALKKQGITLKTVNDISEGDLFEYVRSAAALIKKYYAEGQIILIQTRYADSLVSKVQSDKLTVQGTVEKLEQFFRELLPDMHYIPVPSNVYTDRGKPLEWCKLAVEYVYQAIYAIINNCADAKEVKDLLINCESELEREKKRFAKNATEKLFDDRIETLRKGMLIANQYCSYDPEIFYLIMNRHLGDTLRTMRTVKAIKAYYGETASRYHFDSNDLDSVTAQSKRLQRSFPKLKKIKKLFIIASPSNSGVARLYSDFIDGVITLNKDQIDALEEYAYSSCAVHQNIVCDEHAQFRVGHKTNTDEGQWVRSVMFGITDMEWDLCIPHGYCSCVPSVVNETEKATDLYIKQSGFDIKRGIILCPAAKSTSMLDENIWVSYAKFLSKNGYAVYTNVSNNELPIEGTKSIDCDVDILACLGKRGVKFVSVQSGLSDVLETICPKSLNVIFVIKPDKQNLQIAVNRWVMHEGLTVKNNGCKCLRIEHFEEDYVLKLLEDNFY